MAFRVPDLEDLILNYDPLAPHPRFFASATEMMLARAAPVLPDPVPWPVGGRPATVHPPQAPSPSDPLPQCDVLVVTWTVAEARALATLFTPGSQLEDWSQYKRHVDAYIPKVTNTRAPFNNPASPLYFRSLGLYQSCRIGDARLLCFKAGLHFAKDGPAVAVKDLWNQMLDETGCSVVITTGTGGGIGSEVKLGDAVIGGHTVFDCLRQFRNAPFAHATYATTPLSGSIFNAVSTAMLRPNTRHLPAGNGLPTFIFPRFNRPHPDIVTTDFFAYDDTNNTFELQDKGLCCDMGDAVLGLVISERQNSPRWYAVRNASDPQMDGSLPQRERDAEAARIYMRYGIFTTVTSILATWCIIRNAFPGPTPAPLLEASLKFAELKRAKSLPAVPTPEEVLLALVSSNQVVLTDISGGAVPAETIAALERALSDVNVPFSASDITYRSIVFTAQPDNARQMYLAHVCYDDVESFRGTYLFEDNVLIVKKEFVSS